MIISTLSQSIRSLQFVISTLLLNLRINALTMQDDQTEFRLNLLTISFTNGISCLAWQRSVALPPYIT